jgi:hypothetical protein
VPNYKQRARGLIYSQRPGWLITHKGLESERSRVQIAHKGLEGPRANYGERAEGSIAHKPILARPEALRGHPCRCCSPGPTRSGELCALRLSSLHCRRVLSRNPPARGLKARGTSKWSKIERSRVNLTDSERHF